MNKIFFLIIVLINFLSCRNDVNIKNSDKSSIDSLKTTIINTNDLSMEISFIKSFYKNYITEYDKVKVNPTKINYILKRYCSKEFLKVYNSYEYLDYNPFINGQDYSSNFLKILKIEKSNKQENRFVVLQMLNDKLIELLEIELVKEKDSFKINNLYEPDGVIMLSMQSKDN